MKKKLYLLFLVIFAVMAVFYISCKKDSSSSGNTDTSVNETLCINPEDPQIIQIDSAGRKLVIMGVKDATGLPISGNQALVDAPDLDPGKRMLMQFTPDGTLFQASSPKLGIMTFNYVSDTAVVIKLTLPDTNGTYQMTWNPQKTKSLKGGCGCGKKKDPVKGPMRADKVVLPVSNGTVETAYHPVFIKQTKSANLQGNITATYVPGGQYVTGLTVSGTYTTDQGKTGAMPVTSGSPDGVFYYEVPANPAPPPPSGFKAAAYSIFNKLCYGSIPLGLAKETICGAFIETGIGFAACEVILTSYVWLCRMNTAYKVGSFTYDWYTAGSVSVTFTAQHPALPLKTQTVTINPSNPLLPSVAFTYDAMATFADVYTVPSSPMASEGYTITAILNNVGPATSTVRLSMVGTDGYTKSEDFDVAPGGSCQLGIPGGAQGVRDDITAQIITGAAPLQGQIVHLHLIFR